MHRASLIATALTCALVVACGDQAPTESAVPRGPDFRTDHNEDGPGAIVTGGEVPFTFVFTDRASGLGVIAGVAPEDLPGFCADEEVESGTSIVKDVIRPDGSIMGHERAHKVTLMVFRDDDGELCDGSAPFAVGTGNFMIYDNDFFFSGNRTLSFGFRLNGQVTDADGRGHHVSAAFQGNIGRDGDVRFERGRIKLR